MKSEPVLDISSEKQLFMEINVLGVKRRCHSIFKVIVFTIEILNDKILAMVRIC